MDKQEQSNNFKNTLIILLIMIILGLTILHYTDYLGDKKAEREQIIKDIYNNVSLTDNENKDLNISNLNNTIMIEEDKTLADNNKTLLNQS